VNETSRLKGNGSRPFDWLELSAPPGIVEKFNEILCGLVSFDPARRDALCCGLLERMEMLGRIAR